MGSVRDLYHRIDDQTGNKCTVRISTDHGLIYNLLHDDNHLVGRKGHLFLHTEESPQMSVPLLIGSLCLDNCHIWVEWGHHGHFSIAIGALDNLNLVIDTGHIGAEVALQREER